MNKKTDDIFVDLPLWTHFLNTASEEQITLVRQHLNFAMPLLDYYTAAFRTYTLHNTQHQKNIITILGKILGEEITNLTSLEATFLILSAVYHDIGMVFKPEELDTENIIKEPEFFEFLEKNSSAKLMYEIEKPEISSKLVEWYCRSMHAQRVWIFLEKSNNIFPLIWKGMPFKNQLGYVCESHNLTIDEIKKREADFDNDFLAECDLTLCAILLRIADILDFDNTRSPQSVYDYLELSKHKNSLESISDFEWAKHLNSKGFDFKRDENNNLKLIFKAAPSHPSIEIGIRSFLEMIESELLGCSKLKKICSSRWQNFQLPDGINKDYIISTNFRSGKYHLSLSQEKVLDLLTGEDLYNDEYIFLRELIQNAIDTSRHREFKERLNHKGFNAEEIEISYFTDFEGYNWVRVDDYGMGMNEEIISNHLLKKGESYYKSDKFKLEKLLIDQSVENEFIPISRFGIGLLSCFIIGDKIEISTKHVNEPKNGHRLTLEGRNGYFVFQSNEHRHTPNPMPAENKFENGYRSKAGTSIAIRIDRNKEYQGFNLRENLENYILCSPIKIKYRGKNIGGDWKKLLEDSWAENQIIEIDNNFVKEAEATFNIDLPESIKINVNTINLSTYALNNNLKGQMLFINLIVGSSKKSKPNSMPNFTIHHQDENLIVKVNKKIKENGIEKDIQIEYKESTILSKIKIPKKITNLFSHRNSNYDQPKHSFNGFRLSHNGIIIHDRGHFNLNNFFDNYNFHGYQNHQYLYTGIIYFQDHLLPSLTVSRNEIKDTSFELSINVINSLKELNNFISESSFKFDFFNQNRFHFTNYDRSTIKKTKIYENHKEYWDNEPFFITFKGSLSINEIKKIIANEVFSFPSTFLLRNKIMNTFLLYMFEENFDIKINIEEQNQGAVLITSHQLTPKRSFLPDALSDFSPLTFFVFNEKRRELVIGNKINIEHQYIQWYISAAEYLRNEFHYYSRQLIHGLFYTNKNETIEDINAILDRLRKSLPDSLKPNYEINLIKEDFYN